MSYVVTNNKLFKEFKTLEEAVKFFNSSDEFGLRIAERDVFGNLNDVAEDKIRAAQEKLEAEKEFEEQIPEEKNAETPSAQARDEPAKAAAAEEEKEGSPEDSLMTYVKWGFIAVFAVIVIYLFFSLVLPIIIDFYQTWRAL